MAKVFLSYDQDDTAFVENLNAALRKVGLETYWDQNIAPGRNFDEVIEKHLMEADAIIVVWSKESVASQWVRAEAATAMQMNKLIPVTISDMATLKIPLPFTNIKATVLDDWTNDETDPRIQSLAEATQLKHQENAAAATSQSSVAKAHLVALETTYFEAISKSKDIDDWRAYLRKYPKGEFAEIARSRVRSLAARSPFGRIKTVAAAALGFAVVAGVGVGGYVLYGNYQSQLEADQAAKAAAAETARLEGNLKRLTTYVQDVESGNSFSDAEALALIEVVADIPTEDFSHPEFGKALTDQLRDGASAFISADRYDFSGDLDDAAPGVLAEDEEISELYAIAYGLEMFELPEGRDGLWTLRDEGQFEEMRARFEAAMDVDSVERKFPEWNILFGALMIRYDVERGVLTPDQAQDMIERNMARIRQLEPKESTSLETWLGVTVEAAYHHTPTSTEARRVQKRAIDLIAQYGSLDTTGVWQSVAREFDIPLRDSAPIIPG
ncbi:MAG: toll/interleukin-1 receptor domain-containing protein [Pseudomonadota bacterium]